jgi:hypothetical protein
VVSFGTTEDTEYAEEKFFGCAGNFCKPREINILFNHRDTETTEEKRYEGAVG